MSQQQLEAQADLSDLLDELGRARAPELIRDLELRVLDARYDTALRLLRDAPERRSGPARPKPASRPPTSPSPRSVRYAELTPAAIRSALATHACLHVKGMLEPPVAAEMVAGIDLAFASYDRVMSSGGDDNGDEWSTPFMPVGSPVHVVRPWLRSGGGMFAADSPRLSARWFGLLRDIGLLSTVTDYLGESPVTSLDKCTLRRVKSGDGIEWHQDGAFLGLDCRALNVWVALTDTRTAPSLEVVARPFDQVLETGTGGATYHWSIGDEVIEQSAAGAPIISPQFAVGDALIFDGSLVHRTQQATGLPGTRYAIETWLFPPSRFPEQQEVPLAL